MAHMRRRSPPMVLLTIVFGMLSVPAVRADGPALLVSLTPGGAAADGFSSQAGISGNAQTIVFLSDAGDLLDTDDDGSDVFASRRLDGRTVVEQVNVTPSAEAGDLGTEQPPSVSQDGDVVRSGQTTSTSTRTA